LGLPVTLGPLAPSLPLPASWPAAAAGGRHATPPAGAGGMNGRGPPPTAPGGGKNGIGIGFGGITVAPGGRVHAVSRVTAW